LLKSYRVVSSLAQYLDLNSLHDLSTTCRQIHANLSQHRPQIVRQTLRCVNDEDDAGTPLTYETRRTRAHLDTGSNATRAWEGRLTSGKVSRCARDLVGECRRCGTIVCRVCQYLLFKYFRHRADRLHRIAQSSTLLPAPSSAVIVVYAAPAQSVPLSTTQRMSSLDYPFLISLSRLQRFREALALVQTLSTSVYLAATLSAAPISPTYVAGPGERGTQHCSA